MGRPTTTTPAGRLYLAALAGREIRAISLQQPWASLLAYGFIFPREMKQIETRPFGTDYRGPVAIHASQSIKPESRACCEEEPIKQALRRLGIHSLSDFPLGGILSVGELLDVRKIAPPDVKLAPDGGIYMYPPPPPELHFGNYEPDRYGWIFSNMYLLSEPIPVKGGLSLWRYQWPD